MPRFLDEGHVQRPFIYGGKPNWRTAQQLTKPLSIFQGRPGIRKGMLVLISTKKFQHSLLFLDRKQPKKPLELIHAVDVARNFEVAWMLVQFVAEEVHHL